LTVYTTPGGLLQPLGHFYGSIIPVEPSLPGKEAES